jgi:hypothetical protein
VGCFSRFGFLVARGRFFPASRLIMGVFIALSSRFRFSPAPRSPGKPTGLGHALPRSRRWLQGGLRRVTDSPSRGGPHRTAEARSRAPHRPRAPAQLGIGAQRFGRPRWWQFLAIGYGVLSPEPDGFHSVAQGLVGRAPPPTCTREDPGRSRLRLRPHRLSRPRYRAMVAVSFSQSAQPAVFAITRATPIDRGRRRATTMRPGFEGRL